MKRIWSISLTTVLAGCTMAKSLPSPPDPTVTDPDKYQVILENDHVRVLRYHDEPGSKTHPHHHRNFVMYALAPFRRKLTMEDDTKRERDFRAGDIAWMSEQSHTGENTGNTPTEVLLVEIK